MPDRVCGDRRKLAESSRPHDWPARVTRQLAFKRTIVVAAIALLVAIGALVAGSPPTRADTLNVTNQSVLRATLLTPSPGLVQLGGSFDVTGSDLLILGDATLDLNGHELTTRNIILVSGVTLTITDDSAAGTGRLTVTSGEDEGAGIQTTDATPGRERWASIHHSQGRRRYWRAQLG